MSHLTTQYFHNVDRRLRYEGEIIIFLGKFILQSCFKGLRKAHWPPTYSYLDGVGTADTEITSCKRGRVRLHGSWWSALSNSNMTIHPGQKVRVTSRQSHILLVELSQYG